MSTSPHQDAYPKSELIRVTDSAGVKEFPGFLLSEITTESATAARWTEMMLYKTTDGTGRYILWIIGRSVMYHEYKGPCNSGIRTRTADLPEDSEPCHECDPSELDAVVALEEDRPAVHVCADAQEVLVSLRNKRSRDTLSGPAQRLLKEAALEDAGIRAAISTVSRI